MAKKQSKKPVRKSLTTSNNIKLICVAAVIIAVLIFVFCVVSPYFGKVADTGGSIKNETAAGDAVLDISSEMQEMSDILNEMDNSLG